MALNVNGYNATIHAWVKALLENNHIDVLFLSETKKKESDLRVFFDDFPQYDCLINVHTPTQYHGVVFLIHKECQYKQLPVNLGCATRKDTKSCDAANGRIIVFELNSGSKNLDSKITVVGTYVPNSGVKDEPDKFKYRTEIWDPTLYTYLNVLKQQGPVLWLGDLNIAPQEIDVSHPKRMVKMAGFRPKERENFNAFINTGWIDTWRYDHPNGREYTWLSYRPREGYGMRLDHVIVSEDLKDSLAGSFILPGCPNTDHVAVGVYINS